MDKIKALLTSKKAKPPPPPKRIDTIVQGVPSRFVGVVRRVDSKGNGAKQKQRLLLVTKNLSTVFLGPNGLIDKMVPPGELDSIEFDNATGHISIKPKDGSESLTLAFDDVNIDGRVAGVESQDRRQKLLDFLGVVKENLPHVPVIVKRPPTPDPEPQPVPDEEVVVAPEPEREPEVEQEQATDAVEQLSAADDIQDVESAGTCTSDDGGSESSEESTSSSDGGQFEAEACALLRRAIEERERGLLLKAQLQARREQLSAIQSSVLGARQATQLAMLIGAICERQLKLRMTRAETTAVRSGLVGANYSAPNATLRSPLGPRRPAGPLSPFVRSGSSAPLYYQLASAPHVAM